jgi:hypothetical protein
MKKLLLAAPLAMVSFAAAHSQAISVNGGAIQGSITDPSGSGVPGASIVITSKDEGTSKTLTADKAGFYSVGPLNPGEYTVAITAPGFERLEVTTRILTGTATPGTFKLTVGRSSETVEVTTGDIQVNTDQAGVSDVITREQIASLPVNGRNFLDLAQIEPGVQLQNGTSFDPTKSGYTGISVNGVSGRTTRIILDGSDITDEFVGTTIFNVSQGAVAEFQLNRSTQDVSGEVTSQGQVLVSTRSGTNAIHGELFYLFQDQRALYANPNTTAPHTPPFFQRNQAGGSIGGPIIKDKLFIFGNAERIQQLNASPANLGSIFNGSTTALSVAGATYPSIGAPYHQTYSTVRLDYSGPFGGHYFARGNYNVDSSVTGTYYSVYANRDNTWGSAFGADFSHGRMTHSFRGGYEKFHNLIGDASGSGVYNPLGGSVALTYSGQIAFGPNANAPQATYQSDKQLRYDGSWTKGSHNIRFGGALNRVQAGAYAAFYKLAPRVTLGATAALNPAVPNTTTNPNNLGCNGMAGAAACTNDPVNGYNLTSGFTFSNGLGYSTEIPGFNQPYGGSSSWRGSGYIADAWKITPSFNLSAGLRYSLDTNRENNDIDQPTCAAYLSGAFATAVASYVCSGKASSTYLSSLFDPSLNGRVQQPSKNLGPQLGFVYSPGNHKTVFRGGFGIYYESVVWNNSSNARSGALPTSYGYATVGTVCSAYSITYPDNTVSTKTPDGQDLQTWCKTATVKNAAPQILAIAQKYQALVTPSTNASYLARTLSGSGMYGQNFKTPLSEQWNFGLQRELFKGGIISADYVHNTALRIGQTIDLNHIGAARTFNSAYGLAAINRTSALVTTATCGTATAATAQSVVSCIIANGIGANHTAVTINNFASQGLDTAATYTSSQNYKLAKGTAASVTPAAFPGLNPDLGSGAFIRPTGRSGYDALQLVYRQQKAHPAPGIVSSNLQVSYSLSRIVSNLNSSDEFFTSGSYDKDNPNQFIGRNSLDRKHQLSFGGSATIKYGARIGLIGHFASALATTMALDSGIGNGALFQTDITGDGTTGDVAPGSLPGDYMHRYNGSSLNSYINTFNGSYAGKATPAGQAVITSGLMSLSQLTALKGVIQPISAMPQNIAPNNPTFRSMDANISYPISLRRFREGLNLEPGIAFYNVGNFSNFGTYTGTLQNTTTAGLVNSGSGGNRYINGTNSFAVNSTSRTSRGAGVFAQGAPRATEFSLKVNF